SVFRAYQAHPPGADGSGPAWGGCTAAAVRGDYRSPGSPLRRSALLQAAAGGGGAYFRVPAALPAPENRPGGRLGQPWLLEFRSLDTALESGSQPEHHRPRHDPDGGGELRCRLRRVQGMDPGRLAGAALVSPAENQPLGRGQSGGSVRAGCSSLTHWARSGIGVLVGLGAVAATCLGPVQGFIRLADAQFEVVFGMN